MFLLFADEGVILLKNVNFPEYLSENVETAKQEFRVTGAAVSSADGARRSAGCDAPAAAAAAEILARKPNKSLSLSTSAREPKNEYSLSLSPSHLCRFSPSEGACGERGSPCSDYEAHSR
jgi:hypothetical protein